MWTSRDQPRRSHPSFLLRRQDSSDKYDEVHQKSLTNLTPILKKLISCISFQTLTVEAKKIGKVSWDS